ncbi:hypothetical protein EPVG_00168 [Emiliania huxleyi virus 201]|nr:hypothetical protein ENVG_00259 [Emiliania huxleyi virus 84]AEO98435.1 hypothetical protein ELVG_00134 [Emiliania huxleyi virus 203]AEP15270.1 hypothetical protein EOVG_00333 [Emiliania huxleyi virus 88]AEP15541.1 hypothetical protein EQVG_00131 [Emiliania huxleyi virus 207]AEP15963.1 hypothetical protein ERVG_00085 [Emiliania huxleyi virus 208]AET98055.1 hypothetical protein EPVG_00168 [Emiliania huxleyi virus 201]AHA54950.1 hypothetical protein EhV145_00400 [Emiliania huxleyi virus 145]
MHYKTDTFNSISMPTACDHHSSLNGKRICIPIYIHPHEYIESTVTARPSVYNKSPYVGDIHSEKDNGITHMPSLDLGGKCTPGAAICVTQKMDKRGHHVKQEYSKKYGTPATMYITQLIKCTYSDIWIGAHPSQGEKLFNFYASRNHLPGFQDVVSIQAEVANVAGCDMRSDFLVKHADGTYTLVEVKTIVDLDRDKSPKSYVDGLSIFPWGKPRQKDDLTGNKVVSSRAIKHVRELTKIATQENQDPRYPKLKTAIVFMVVRNDATAFMPDYRTCPTFHKELIVAKNKGVKIVSYAFNMKRNGTCPFISELPIVYNLSTS